MSSPRNTRKNLSNAQPQKKRGRSNAAVQARPSAGSVANASTGLSGESASDERELQSKPECVAAPESAPQAGRQTTEFAKSTPLAGRETSRSGGESSSNLASAAPSAAPPFGIRAGQRELERGIDEHRIVGFLTRRQYGKTTEAARIALKKMMRIAGHDVVFGSVKLDLGREMVRKEAAQMQRAFALLAAQAAAAQTLLDVVDPLKHRSVAGIHVDDWSELYEQSRLEFRLYHSRTIYSRTKVVALTPDAVGETGDLILDEVGRVKHFRAVWEAVKPIISSNPQFRCLLTTTPPPDDSHYSFELLAPPVGEECPVRPEGNWYRSELGVWVLRVTAWDAYADGIPLYDDDTGEPLDPDASRARDHDKEAWDRNYGVKFIFGGTSACSFIALDTAQKRGVGQCGYFNIQSDSDFGPALVWLGHHLGNGPIGLGWDLATTTKATSNPSALCVMERQGAEYIHRAIVTWKTADPDIAIERAMRIARVVRSRPAGPARRLCIDATNERYFAQSARKELGSEVPVELVVGSETTQRPGMEEPLTMKQYLGGLLVGELDDNHLLLPPERYVREDWRLVRKERGQFVCEPDVDGKHGDTFDAAKLALHALTGSGPFFCQQVKPRKQDHRRIERTKGVLV